MTADTYSAGLGFLIMGTGNDNNTWGTNANSAVFQTLEDAISGGLTSAVTGGTLDLSGSPPPAAASQARYAALVFTGVLTSTQIVVVPNLSKLWFVNNKTTGAFGLKIKTTAGTAVNAPSGKATWIYCDGSNVMVRLDREDVGVIDDVAGTTVPGGTFECTGGTKLIADYPDLYARVGTTWGGDGITTFGIPDFYTAGRYRRSRTASVAVGVTQADGIASHVHANTAATATTGTTGGVSDNHTHGGTTGTESATHSHSVTAVAGAGSINIAAGAVNAFGFLGASSIPSGTESATHTHTFSTDGQSNGHTHAFTASSVTTMTNVANTGAIVETRPLTAVVMTCIRY